MKYLIIGAGGTGGVLGFFMTKSGKDVTLIARNEHLKEIKKSGLIVHRMWDDTTECVRVKAEDMESFEAGLGAGNEEKPDVIIECVKGYSLEETVPFIRRVSKPETIVIPVLNIYGTGAKMQEKLPELLVLDGCIYVSANIEKHGVLLMHGKILRVVFGVRNPKDYRPELKQIQKDFTDSQISGELSDDIQRDALEKFSYVSPIGAAGLYCGACAEDFQREGEPREMFKAMIREIMALAEAMGHPFEKDYVEVNLKILSQLAPKTTTSMQRDVTAGRKSEIDGLVYEVVRLARRYNVSAPVYERVAAALGMKE